jgi:hypothetical protein
MYLEIPAERPESIAHARHQFAAGETLVWWDDLPIQNVGDPRIFGTVFPDAPLIHPDFIARILAQAATQPASIRGVGGKKVRDAETWAMPAAKLLTLRAMLLFCRSQNVRSAHVLDRWANVMEPGEYSTPHCHYDADAALVYAVDPGEKRPDAPLDGDFELIDPRIPACCPTQAERPIRGLSPRFVPGMMLIFPAQFLHHVRPYSGRTPRITLAWNISAGPPPRDRVIDPTRQVPFQLTAGLAAKN